MRGGSQFAALIGLDPCQEACILALKQKRKPTTDCQRSRSSAAAAQTDKRRLIELPVAEVRLPTTEKIGIITKGMHPNKRYVPIQVQKVRKQR